MQNSNIFKYAIIGITLTSIIGILSNCTGIDEKVLWDGLDEIQREYFPKGPINDYIIHDSEKLQRRIRRDVNRAIDNVTPEYDRIIQKDNQKYLPKYIQEKNNDEVCYTEACKSLGGPIRMCAPWYTGCPSVTEPLTERGI